MNKNYTYYFYDVRKLISLFRSTCVFNKTPLFCKLK